jgi:hypothetical protein
MHPLDPGKPLKHPNGEDYTDSERQTFFENVENVLRSKYKQLRENHYNNTLPIGDQLDMLWHELKDNGSITTSGTWFTTIQQIKDAHAKDDTAYEDAVAQVAAMRNSQE